MRKAETAKTIVMRLVTLSFSFVVLSACATNSDNSSGAEIQPEPIVTPIVNPLDSFLDQEEEIIDATVFLVNKYEPGDCFGMPSPVPGFSVREVISRNPRLVTFVRDRFGAESSFQVYTRIIQLRAIEISSGPDGTFQYNFTDGKCCSIFHYRGKLEFIGDEFRDTLLERSEENVPC